MEGSFAPPASSEKPTYMYVPLLAKEPARPCPRAPAGRRWECSRARSPRIRGVQTRMCPEQGRDVGPGGRSHSS